MWNKPDTRPRVLSLTQALKITLLYLRQNSPEEDFADRFAVSQPTISRTIHRIEKALLNLEELKIPALESLKNIPGSLVVDGTLVPLDSSAEESNTPVYKSVVVRLEPLGINMM